MFNFISVLRFILFRFKKYMRDPNSVSPEWREYFESKDSTALEGPPRYTQPSSSSSSTSSSSTDQLIQVLSQVLSSKVDVGTTQSATKVARVLNLYRSYQTVGHEKAKTDPLKLLDTYGNILQIGKRKKNNTERLDYRFHGFSDTQLEKEIFIGNVFFQKFKVK